MARGNHSFTEQDIHSRFKAIVGHTVAEVDAAGVLACPPTRVPAPKSVCRWHPPSWRPS